MEEALTCPIGFEIYNDNTNKPFTLDSCGHSFCIKCIQMLKIKSCPQCRKMFDKTHPNYTLIDIITSKGRHELIKIKNDETKLKLKQLEEYLTDFNNTLQQGKCLNDKNLCDLKDEIENCAKIRIEEIIQNKNNLLSNVQDLEKQSISEYEKYATRYETILNKFKLWQDLSINDNLTTKEKEDLNNEIKYLEVKIDDCKNLNYYMFSSSYSNYDFVPMGEISSFLTRFIPNSNQVHSNETITKQASEESNLLESKSGSEILVDIASNEMSNMFVNAPLISPQIIIPIINKIRLKGHSDTVHAVCYMKNSNRIITGSRDKTIKIWNIENGDCLTTLMGHSNMISSLILISDTKLASAGWDNLIKIWDLNTNKCIRTYKGHDKWVECLCLFKNLQLISGSFDNTIKIWDLNSTSCIKTLKGHSYWIICLKIYSNNKLISGSRDKTIKIWNLNTFECENTLLGHTNDVLCLEFIPNGNLLSGSGDHSIRIWDLNACICLNVIDGSSSVWSLRFLHDRYLISGYENGDILIWDLNSLKKPVSSIKGHPSLILNFDLLNNEYLLSYSCQNKSILAINSRLNKIIS